ncbi:MAG: 2,5-diketo-D-gluconate reductase A [Promethearchaeota archaeon]|jgi:diketogulonate reductase-like aldo/keto reductase|nr:MAG: 2,5-diketo-D-gluconate reductase A [Candidatus Lokiarchaeota archaeon]
MNLNIESTYKLNNGLEIPILGFGTWDLRGKTALNATIWALESGYRLIDTASFYNNEVEVGEAIIANGISREDIFITTKVWETEMGYQNTINAFERSLNRLNVDYIDLYLIHWPRAKRLETWHAMETLYEEGRVKAIGVSNFKISHLDQILNNSEIIPTVNQIEFSPFLFQKELLEHCRDHNIKIEAYAPLTRTNKFNNPVIGEMSQKYEKSPAQILIRWGLQHHLVEIPRSSSKRHIKENADIFDFEIDINDMEKLDGLDEGFRAVEDPIFD